MISMGNSYGDTPYEAKPIMLQCVDCGKEFIYSIGEQHFYKARDLFPPKRCAHCRLEKRTQE